MKPLAAAVLGLLAGLAVGATLAREYGPAGALPPAQDGREAEIEALRRELASVEAMAAQLESELEQLTREEAGGSSPDRSGESAADPSGDLAARAARRLALVIHHALSRGDVATLRLLTDDPAATELVVLADEAAREGNLDDPGGVAELAAWVRDRSGSRQPSAEYVADRHAPDPLEAFHNVVLELERGYLSVQLEPNWTLTKVVASDERLRLD